MPFQRFTTHRESVQAVSIFATLCCLCLLAQTTTAQQPPSSPPDDHPYTLHVYTRLIQMPTLVLSHNRTELPPIDPEKFNISIDSGPRFHATHIRREGDDPITLAILVDVRRDESELLPAFSRAFSAWISASLKPQDHISIYAIDCAMLETSAYVPANSATLQQDLDTAISSPKTHRDKAGSPCSLHLWDSVAIAMQQISTLPGRRVLLAVSDGYDADSRTKPSDIRSIATNDAVTIFGLTNPTSIYVPQEMAFHSLVQSSGGIYLETPSNKLPAALASFVSMLRGRYILEFPTPANPTAGRHDIHVTIDHTSAFITTSGLTVPLPNPSVEENPLTIHNDNPDAPIIGNHKPIPNF